MMRMDYYQLLDIGRGATAAEVKLAYRRQARLFHPDLNQGNPEAEERFKLVAEAYRTLGEPERRADYDAWLERQERLRMAPELARMAAAPRVRVSVRHAYERRAQRGRRRSRYSRGTRVPRLFALKPVGDSGILSFLLFYGLCAAVMVPWFISYAGREAPQTLQSPAAPRRVPGESDLPPEVQTRELLNFHERIYRAAEAGDPRAQFRYGMMLYHGYQGIPQDHEAAMQWWQKAAEAGHKAAGQMLNAARTAEQESVNFEPIVL